MHGSQATPENKQHGRCQFLKRSGTSSGQHPGQRSNPQDVSAEAGKLNQWLAPPSMRSRCAPNVCKDQARTQSEGLIHKLFAEGSDIPGQATSARSRGCLRAAFQGWPRRRRTSAWTRPLGRGLPVRALGGRNVATGERAPGGSQDRQKQVQPQRRGRAQPLTMGIYPPGSHRGMEQGTKRIR
jgi:hypothetical protein